MVSTDVTRKWSRRQALAMAGAAAAVPFATSPAQSMVRSDTLDIDNGAGDSADLFAQWEAAPGTHPLIPNVSQAGYKLGDAPPVVSVVASVADYGALPGPADGAQAFNDAVEDVGTSGGGAILVPAGTYTLSGPVWMHWSNTVLRGQGSGSTVLHFTQPLKDSYWDVFWPHNGGQIFVIPPEQRAFMEQETNWGGPQWLVGDVLADVGSAARGEDVLSVSSTADVSAGDLVVLEVHHNGEYDLHAHLCGDIPPAHAFDWEGKASNLIGGSMAQLRWPVRVDEVLGAQSIRLAQPLKYDLTSDWPAQLREIGPAVHDTGVENLTIRNELVPQGPHNQQDPGANGLCFQTTYDCWATDVRVENCDVGFALTSVKSTTLSDVTVAGRATHHSFVVKLQSHDNLVEDFTIEEFTVPLPAGSITHGVSFINFSSGNVYRNGIMDEGTFDTHRGIPFENVSTNITKNGHGSVGGNRNTNGPHYGARHVHWNIRNNGHRRGVVIADLAPLSASVGIQGQTATDSGVPPDFPLQRPTIDWPLVFVDTFEGDIIGDPPSGYVTDGPPNAVTVQEETGHGNVLRLQRAQEQDIPARAVRDFAQVDGHVLFSFSVQRGADPVGFVGSLMDSAGNARMRVQLTRVNDLRYGIGDANGDLVTIQSGVGYQADTRYDVMVVVDSDQDSFDLYVGDLLAVRGQPLASGGPASAIELRLPFNQSPPNVGSFSLDDIAIYEGDPADGPPPSGGLESVIADFGLAPSVIDLYTAQRDAMEP